MPSGTIVKIEPLRLPSSDDTSRALRIFFKILSAAVQLGFKERNAVRMGGVASQTFGRFIEDETITLLTNALIQINDRLAVGAFYEEVLYFNWTFREALQDQDQSEVENMGMHYGMTAEDPRSEALLEGGETIKGSLESLIERFPPWLKRLLDIASELMKLRRLDIGHGQ